MPKVEFEKSEVLWKDRKRILGLPISFTRYEVNRDRFVTHKGLFNTTTNEILLYRILDIKLERRFSQKIFGVGTITLFSADQSDQTFRIENVKNPEKVREFLSRIVEQERSSKGLTGREIYGAAGRSAGPPDDGPPPPFVDTDGDGIPD